MTQPPLEVHAQPVDAELTETYRRSSFWAPTHLGEFLRRNVAQWPHLPAIEVEGRRFDYREIGREVARLGAALRALGAEPGDRICWQTPNWWESYVIALACWEVGAVSVPVVPIYRSHEVTAIVEAVRPAFVFVPVAFRDHDFPSMWDDVLSATGMTGSVQRIVLRGQRAGWHSYDELPSYPANSVLSPGDRTATADDPCLILFSSGTTAAPKAVVHCSRSLVAEAAQTARAWSWGWQDVCYMPAPLQHITGLMFAVVLPVYVGGSAVLDERWDPVRALDMIRTRGITIMSGATVFLRELVEACTDSDSLPLKVFGCGGAAIPGSVMQAAENLGLSAFRQYGMTELPTVTIMNASYPVERRLSTDGKIAPGVEVRVDPIDDRRGELLVRGPELMLGYLSAANGVVFEPGGWLRTGDLGWVDDEGFVTIEGRLKEIINRGGEKYSAVEVEELLTRHPRVLEAAVVPVPHPRLGETGCAVVMTVGPTDGLERELIDFLKALGLARQKFPEQFVFVDSLPRTASGKVRKFDLRELITRG